jgi:GH25 family lysozyme M1 (1,4-beta-N-acetylmuramidase)
MKKYGIDISRWQGKPDFSRLKKEVDFIILQAGYGRYSSQKDSEFERSYAECKKYGIPVGVYWYSYAKSNADALAEAKACMEVIAGKRFEYPIYYDLEEGLGALGRSLVSSIATIFCSALEDAGWFAGIYISRSPAQSYLTDEVCGKYSLWLAEYGERLNWTGAVGMWQNSSSGHFGGINGDVDTDVCYVDYPTLIKSGGFNGYTKPEPTKELDKPAEAWYKHGDKLDHGLYAIKCRMKALGYGYLDLDGGFGGGTEKAVNDLLRLWGYRQTGIIGKNFVGIVMK